MSRLSGAKGSHSSTQGRCFMLLEGCLRQPYQSVSLLCLTFAIADVAVCGFASNRGQCFCCVGHLYFFPQKSSGAVLNPILSLVARRRPTATGLVSLFVPQTRELLAKLRDQFWPVASAALLVAKPVAWSRLDPQFLCRLFEKRRDLRRMPIPSRYFEAFSSQRCFGFLPTWEEGMGASYSHVAHVA